MQSHRKVLVNVDSHENIVAKTYINVNYRNRVIVRNERYNNYLLKEIVCWACLINFDLMVYCLRI